MNYARYLLLIAAWIAYLTLGSAHSAVVQATITVTTPDDELNIDGDCALREAIRAANLNQAVDGCAAGSDTDLITIPAGTYTLTRSGVDNTSVGGDLDLLGTITLSGADSASTIIDGNRLDRVFDVRPDANVTIRNLTIQGGAPRYDEYDQNDYGAGVRNNGTLIMHESMLTENNYPSTGGGIANFGTLTVIRTTFQRNGTIFGGGLFNRGQLTIIESVIQEHGSMWGSGIANEGTATIIGSLLTENFAEGESHGSGAAIYNDGTLTVSDSDIHGNGADWGGGIFNAGGEAVFINTRISENTYSEGYGAGIYNSAILTLENSRVTDNRGRNGGGGGAGITNLGLVHINTSTISNNSAMADGDRPGAGDNGGGIFNIGTVLLTSSTISGNAAVRGGGILNGGTVVGVPPNGSESVTSTGILIARNSTISGNSAIEIGGGILNSGVGYSSSRSNVISLNNVTITGNRADQDRDGIGSGGGLYSFQPDSIHSSNSVIAGNTLGNGDASDCVGSLNSRGYTLIGTLNGCRIVGVTTGNLIDVDPRLGPLQADDGPSATHALLPDSPAIDAGSPVEPGSGLPSCEAFDQRGVTRPQDGNSDGTRRCDMGAYEVQNTPMISRRALMPMISR